MKKASEVFAGKTLSIVRTWKATPERESFSLLSDGETYIGISGQLPDAKEFGNYEIVAGSDGRLYAQPAAQVYVSFAPATTKKR